MRSVVANLRFSINSSINPEKFMGSIIDFERYQKFFPDQIKEVLSQSQSIEIIDDVNEKLYPTPLIHGDNTNVVYVGRIRKDHTLKNGMNLWVVADNIRKGAALNGVQIAEVLVKNYL